MYKKSLLLLFMLLSHTAFSQVSILNTRKFLNDQLEDINGLVKKFNEEFTYYLLKAKISTLSSDNNKIVLSYERYFSDDTSDELQIILNPKYIESITLLNPISEYDGFKALSVKLSGNFVVTQQKSTNGMNNKTTNTFYFPIISGDDKLFDRVKNALFNLRDLYKLKDSSDPFAN